MKLDFFILALVSLVYVKSQTILLTPILPPSAFENEFYQVRFRVMNLVGPVFQFRNVPQFFTASSAGLLSGVPTKQGLYTIEVQYSNSTFKKSQQVIIQVRRGTKLTNYNTSNSQQNTNVDNNLKPKEQYLFSYQQNDQLEMTVNVTNGLAPYRFQSIYIPIELQFNNQTGSVSGALHNYGTYLIGINVIDSRNKIVQILIKITVSKKSDTAPKFIFYKRSLLQVTFQVSQTTILNNTLPNLNSTQNKPDQTTKVEQPSKSKQSDKAVPAQNKDQSSIPNKDTDKSTGGAILLPTDSSSSNTITSKNSSINNQPNLDANDKTISKNNESKTDSSSPSSSNSNTTPIIPQEIVKAVETQKKPDEIVKTSEIINKNITAQVDLEAISKLKDQFNQKLQQSKDQLKTCYDNVQISRSTVENLHNAYNDQNLKVLTLKSELQDLKTNSKKSASDLQQKLALLKTYQISKMLAQTQYNRSQFSFDNVNFAHNGALLNLDDNQNKIKQIQNQIQQNKRDLDSYYKIIDDSMAENKLIEQQKAHINEQIKKGSGILSNKSLSQLDFAGCDNAKFYPKSTGVGQVKRAVDKVYLLTNNQLITYGDCSEKEKLIPGDYISWKGYLNNGIISALLIKKVK